MGDWLSDAVAFAEQVGKNLENWFQAIWDALVGDAKALITGLGAVGAGLAHLGDWIHQGLSALGSMLQNAYSYIQDGIQYLADKFREAYNTIGSWIHGAFDTLGNWLSQAYNYLKDGLNWIGTKLHEAYDTFGNWIHQALDTFGDWLKKAHDALGGFLRDGMNYIRAGLDTIGQIIGSGISTLGNYLHTAWNTFSSYVKSAWDWFSENLFKVGQWLWNGLQWLGGFIWGGISYVGQTLYNFGQWLWNGLCWLGSQAGKAIGWIGEQLYNLGQWLWKGINWVAGMAKNIILGVIGFISGGINSIINGVKNWWNGITGYVNGWWQGILIAIRNKIKHIIFNDVAVTTLYKSIERIRNSKDTKDLKWGIFGFIVSPILGALASEIVDIIMPMPSSTSKDGAVLEIIPNVPMLQTLDLGITINEPTEVPSPEKGTSPVSDFTQEKPTMPNLIQPNIQGEPPSLSQPFEAVEQQVEYTGGSRTIVVDTTPKRLGSLGTKIKSVTVKAPIANTARVWLTISEDQPEMTPDEVFMLYPGEAIDIAIDDLGKVWVRAEEGTQRVSYIYIQTKVESE